MPLLPTLHNIHELSSWIFYGPWIRVCGYIELPGSPCGTGNPVDNSPQGRYRSQTLRTAAERDAHCLSKQMEGAR